MKFKNSLFFEILQSSVENNLLNLVFEKSNIVKRLWNNFDNCDIDLSESIARSSNNNLEINQTVLTSFSKKNELIEAKQITRITNRIFHNDIEYQIRIVSSILQTLFNQNQASRKVIAPSELGRDIAVVFFNKTESADFVLFFLGKRHFESASNIELSEILRLVSNTAILRPYYTANRVFWQVFIPLNDFEKKILATPTLTVIFGSMKKGENESRNQRTHSKTRSETKSLFRDSRFSPRGVLQIWFLKPGPKFNIILLKKHADSKNQLSTTKTQRGTSNTKCYNLGSWKFAKIW